MRWTYLVGDRRRRSLMLCICAVVALLIDAPVAYASYNYDGGKIYCPKGKRPGLVVKARGNPVTVRGHASSGYVVIYDDFNTYSGTTTRYYHASGIYADRGMGWSVRVPVNERGAYVSRMGTYAYCYKPG